MIARTALVVAAAAAALAAGTSAAATKPQIVDAAGDYPVASADIVAGTLELVRARTSRLRMTLVLAQAPDPARPHTYEMSFVVGDCTYRAAYYGHGAPPDVLGASGAGCTPPPGESLPAAQVEVRGPQIVWTVPVSPPLRRGAKLTGISAATQLGGVTSGGPGALVGDTATGTDWVLR